MQDFLTRVGFDHMGRLLHYIPQKQAELGTEISVVKVLNHDDQFNDFHEDDSSKP